MHIDFKNDGYMVVREFFDQTTITIMQTYWDLKWRLINFSDLEKSKPEHSNPLKGPVQTKHDDDVGFSYNFYCDTLMDSIELCYGQKACSILRENLSPTYTYTRIYEKGSSLIPHTDRPSCEISATCPIIISDNKPSQICISKFKYTDSDYESKYNIDEVKALGDYSEVHLYPGDVCFYSGCDRFHWRDPIESDYMIQFFMHFVQSEGEYKDMVFDKRPYMGFPIKYCNFEKN